MFGISPGGYQIPSTLLFGGWLTPNTNFSNNHTQPQSAANNRDTARRAEGGSSSGYYDSGSSAAVTLADEAARQLGLSNQRKYADRRGRKIAYASAKDGTNIVVDPKTGKPVVDSNGNVETVKLSRDEGTVTETNRRRFWNVGK